MEIRTGIAMETAAEIAMDIVMGGSTDIVMGDKSMHMIHNVATTTVKVDTDIVVLSNQVLLIHPIP